MAKKMYFDAVSGNISEIINMAYFEKSNNCPYLNSIINDKAKAATVSVF